jgi:hypothetical protein
MDNKKKILLLAVLGGAGYFAYKKFFKKQEKVEDKPTPSDVGKPQTKDEIKDSPMRAGGTPVSLPPVPLISTTPNSHTLPASPYVAPQVSPKPYSDIALPATPYVAPVQVSPRVTPSSNYGANVSTSLPTWTTLSPTSNFSNSARPLNVTATGGNATNYYATMNGVRSRRKRKPKYCI